jgi:hypothetical protein
MADRQNADFAELSRAAVLMTESASGRILSEEDRIFLNRIIVKHPGMFPQSSAGASSSVGGAVLASESGNSIPLSPVVAGYDETSSNAQWRDAVSAKYNNLPSSRPQPHTRGGSAAGPSTPVSMLEPAISKKPKTRRGGQKEREKRERREERERERERDGRHRADGERARSRKGKEKASLSDLDESDTAQQSDPGSGTLSDSTSGMPSYRRNHRTSRHQGSGTGTGIRHRSDSSHTKVDELKGRLERVRKDRAKEERKYRSLMKETGALIECELRLKDLGLQEISLENRLTRLADRRADHPSEEYDESGEEL